MTKARKYVVLSVVSLLGFVFRIDLKDCVVATMIWVQCNAAKEGKSYDSCEHLYKRISGDWWYIGTALRRFDIETGRTCLCYQHLLSISSLPDLTARMIEDYDAGKWKGTREFAGAMTLFQRTGDVRYLRHMFDMAIYPEDKERNDRARRYYLEFALCLLKLPWPGNAPFPPESSTCLPDKYWLMIQDKHFSWNMVEDAKRTLD